MSKKSLGMITWLILFAILAGSCSRTQPRTASPQSIRDDTAVTATSQADDDIIEVDMWFHSSAGSQREAVIHMINEFNQNHDDIQLVTFELPEFQGYNEQVQAAAYGASIVGELPCILDFDGPNTYNYVWNGFLMPLDGYITPEMKEDFLPSIIAQGTFQDGKLYSLGSFDGALGIWANKQHLEKIDARIPTVEDPWSRKEFEEILAQLQLLPEVDYALDLKMHYGGEWFTYGFSPVLQSFGADLIDRSDYQQADGVLNGPEAIEAMEMIQGWFEKGYISPAEEGDNPFIEGRVGLSWVGHWMAGAYTEALGDDLLLLPMVDFGHGPKTGMGSWNWAITTNCPHPDAAWTVLEFILKAENIVLMTQTNGAIPARKSVLQDSDLYKPGGQLHLYIDQIEAGYSVPRPITPAYPIITKAFSEAFKNIAEGASVEFELGKAVEKIDQAIKAHNGYPLNH